jgi:hypothetical protein
MPVLVPVAEYDVLVVVRADGRARKQCRGLYAYSCLVKPKTRVMQVRGGAKTGARATDPAASDIKDAV